MARTATPRPIGARSETDGLTTHLPKLREILEQERQFRVEQLAELSSDATTGQPVSAGAQEQVTLALQAGAAAALRDIDAALHRIQTDDYGRCQRCDVAIPLERLEIVPSAALCTACQYAEETSTRARRAVAQQLRPADPPDSFDDR